MNGQNAPREAAAMRLGIIGGGFAGWAACHAAVARGLRPIWLSQDVGASEQSCGAADVSPWRERSLNPSIPAPEHHSDETLALMSEWGLFRVQPEQVVSSAGVIRPTDAVGHGVLGLEAFRGSTVGVLDLRRAHFPAAALAKALEAEPWAKASGTLFVPIPVEEALPSGFSMVPLGAMSGFLNQPEERARFSEALRKIGSELNGISAFLCEPLLGLEPEKIDSPFPLGETLSPPEGAFGSRVLAARARWLSAIGLELVQERVEQIYPEDGAVRLMSRARSGKSSTHWVDAAVIATGGLIGGGVGLVPAASGERGSRWGSLLAEDLAVPSGDWDGWDAQADAGAWTSPHYVKGEASRRRRDSSEPWSPLVVVGDARSAGAGSNEPVGTVLGAVSSTLAAMETLLKVR